MKLYTKKYCMIELNLKVHFRVHFFILQIMLYAYTNGR